MQRFCCVSLLCLLVGGAPMPAQSVTGTISGSVLDPSGLAVSGASVMLRERSTGSERRFTTDPRGSFVFASVAPGVYRIAATAQGFKRYEREEVHLTAAETLRLPDIVLEVGAVTESITVSSQGAVVQTASAERAGVVTTQQLDALLIRGRNVMSVLQTLPGIVDTGGSDTLTNSWAINAQGSRTNTNNISIDGATMNAIGNMNNSVVTVSMDAVAEVKVLLSNYQAEFGRTSGANVQIVSRSGTRDFHGLFSYFKRHEDLNANSFFNNRNGLPRGLYRFNTWTYQVGGPVTIPGKFNTGREKLFFFWTQEFWPQTSSTSGLVTVPSDLERAGNFSQSVDLNNRLIVVNDPNTRTPFPGNIVPANRLDASGVALLKVFPSPNFSDRAISANRYNYVFQNANSNPSRTDTLKLNYNVNSNNLFTGNFTHSSFTTEGPNATTRQDNWHQVSQKSVNEGWAFIGRYQKIVNPTLINELNASYVDRPWNNSVEDAQIKRNQRDTVGFRAGQFFPTNNPLGLVPNATFGGVTSAANLQLEARFPLTTDHWIYTVSDTVSKTWNAHTVKLGIYMDRVWATQGVAGTGLPFNGAYDFGNNANNPLNTGYAYANAALGVFNTYSEPSGRPQPVHVARNVEWFAQDNWKVTRRLTLDFGMRFYIVKPSFVEGNVLSGFSPTAFDPARQVRLIQPGRNGTARVGINPVNGQVLPPALIGAVAPNSGNTTNGMVQPGGSIPDALYKGRGVQYAPRFGFAWDVFGNGSTAIRGGFGAFYNRQAQGTILTTFIAQPPIVQTPTIYYSTLASLLSSTGYLFPGNVTGVDQQGKVPMTMNYSLSIQRRIGFGTIVDVGYVGSLARHLLWGRNLNAIPFGANFDPKNIDPTTNAALAPAFLRPRLGYNNINFFEQASSSNYHSMQVTANRRFAKGVQFGAAWTWSRALTYNEGDGGAVSTQVPVRVWNYGLASFDRTHIFKLNYLWALPRMKVPNRVVSYMVNSWQLSGITSFISGAPLGIGFSTTNGADITGSPTDGARIVVLSNPVLPKSERTFSRFFANDVFRVPARGTIGNAATTLIRGPGVNNFDLAIFKDFPIRESIKAQFRAEMYNAFNHTQFNAVDTGARFDPAGAQVNPRFGEMTGAAAPRRIQLAIRFYF
ncbi:MAG: carboxypeptidase regulatory-like domain-containing protein [Acidobacteria bacterium]|nr:carboxypeptidase regulatory-like domain-containing protein [Acidobacteriota bacterium]